MIVLDSLYLKHICDKIIAARFLAKLPRGAQYLSLSPEIFEENVSKIQYAAIISCFWSSSFYFIQGGQQMCDRLVYNFKTLYYRRSHFSALPCIVLGVCSRYTVCCILRIKYMISTWLSRRGVRYTRLFRVIIKRSASKRSHWKHLYIYNIRECVWCVLATSRQRQSRV